MSTQTPQPAHTNGHDRKLSGVRTYRGRKLEDLIPQIRAELGPDAIILRQRDGLTGGVGGFFAQKCVEVDAKAATPQVDFYDEDPEFEEAPMPQIVDAAPSAPEAVDEEALFDSFATRLEQAATHVGDVSELVAAVAPGAEIPARVAAPGPAPVAEIPAAVPPAPVAPAPVAPASIAPASIAPAPVAPAPVADVPAPPAAPAPAPAPVAPAAAAPAPRTVSPAQTWAAKQAGAPDAGDADAIVRELTAQGISDEWAHELVVAAAAHRSPLTAHSDLRHAVRSTLAATIPAAAPLPAAGAAVAFVGPGGVGKTHCSAALAAAYAHGSSLAASVISLGSRDWGSELKELLKLENVWATVAPEASDAQAAVAGGRDGGLVVIDTAAVSPADQIAVSQLAAELQSLAVDAIYIAVPATFSVRAARKLVDALGALGSDGIAVTHADGADQLGIAAELAYQSGMPVAYIHQGVDLDGAMSAADPSSLAARLLP